MKMVFSKGKSKRAITLVELIVAMALTALFAGSCIALILPVTKIYTETNRISRSQLVADSVVDALRAECAKTIVTDSGDVWIYNPSDYDGKVLTSSDVNPVLDGGGGSVLVLRRNSTYCETIAANYVIDDALIQSVAEKDSVKSGTDGSAGAVTSKSVYNISSDDASAGYLHYGYFLSSAINTKGLTYIYPGDYFDYTNPYTTDAYMGYMISLNFHDIGYDNGLKPKPLYVICDVTVEDGDGAVYTRSVALCFS